MKRGIWIGLAAALLFIVILIARLPASWVLGFLPKDIQCEAAGGTLWSGTCSNLKVRNMALGELNWQLQAASLLSGKISGHATLAHPSGTLATDFDAKPNGDIAAHALSADFSLDPALVASIAPQLRGRVQANLTTLRIEKHALAALEGHIEAHELKGLDPTEAGTGDYTLVFPGKRAQAQPGEIQGDVDGSSGYLDIAGTLRLTPEPGYVLDGTVAPRAGAPQSVLQNLAFLGQPDAQGRRPFSQAGTF